MAVKTYYDDLQVARSAAPEVIAAAYRSLSLKYHPDRNMGDARSEQIMKAINEAYAVLSDPVKRKAHDDWIVAQEAKAANHSSARNNGGGGRGNAGSNSRGAHSAKSAGNRSWTPQAATRDMLFRYPIPESLRKFGFLFVAIALFLIFLIANLFDAETTHDYAAVQREELARKKEEASAGAKTNQLLDAWNAAHPQGEAEGNEAKDSSESPGPWEKYQTDSSNSQSSSYEGQATLTTAPNGSKWPDHAGYVQGYDRLNTQGRSRVTIDNSRNSGNAFVKLVDVSQGRPRAVRAVFVPAYNSYTINAISPGLYDIRYKDLEDGGLSRSESFSLSEFKDGNSIRYSDTTITLYKVIHGNMKTFNINEEEFSDL